MGGGVGADISGGGVAKGGGGKGGGVGCGGRSGRGVVVGGSVGVGSVGVGCGVIRSSLESCCVRFVGAGVLCWVGMKSCSLPLSSCRML